MNDLRLAGRIDNDLVLRRTADGTPLVIVELAVKAERTATVDVFTVHVWGARAEAMAAACTKGDRLLVAGFLESSNIAGISLPAIHARVVEFPARPTGRLDPRHQPVWDNTEGQQP